MRRRLVCGNWKMNGTEEESAALAASLLPLLAPLGDRLEIAFAPPFTSLRTVGEKIQGSGIQLAAQDLHPASHGAFTGEISGRMLTALHVRYVIVGHSERRRLFRETNEEIGRKAAGAAAAGLVPILCVGEDEAERLDGRTLGVIEEQLLAGIARLPSTRGDTLVVAYEPVWAIGTGRTATPDQAIEAHRAIRSCLARRAGEDAAASIRILYGGSVTPETATAMLSRPDIDGALVGGASLVAESFAAITHAAAS